MIRARPQILAHRGASSLLPENTLSALSRALGAPHYADGVELDVRFSADEIAFVFHDRTTDRLTGSPGTIEERTEVEVQSLRVEGEPVPRLETAVSALLAHGRGPGPVVLNVEVKSPRDPTLAVSLLRAVLDPLASDRRVELVVSSFDPRVLASAREAGAPWRLALLYEHPDALSCLPLLDGDAPLDLHPDEALVTEEHLDAFARGADGGVPRRVRVWTVDDPWRARCLAQLGVDAIITNRPDTIRRALWSC